MRTTWSTVRPAPRDGCDENGWVELAILIWFAIGAGIAAGAFLLARSAVQLASIAYAVLEHRIDRAGATRQSAALVAVIVAALGVTSLIAAIAILAILGGLFATIGE